MTTTSTSVRCLAPVRFYFVVVHSGMVLSIRLRFPYLVGLRQVDGFTITSRFGAVPGNGREDRKL